MSKFKIIIYDFESNGFLNHPTFQPIELAYIAICNDGTYEEKQIYIKCPEPLSSNITELTRITDDILLEQGCDIKEVFESVQDLFFDDCPKLIVGHNILNFDNPAFNMMQKKYGFRPQIEDSSCFDTGGEFKAELLGWKRFNNVETHEYHKKALGVIKRGLYWNLNEACKHYEVKSKEGAHSAIVDVNNNLQVFLKQKERQGKLPDSLKKYML